MGSYIRTYIRIYVVSPVESREPNCYRIGYPNFGNMTVYWINGAKLTLCGRALFRDRTNFVGESEIIY